MDNRIRVLQVMDKCAIRGSPIHGVNRLLLGWVTEFKKTNVDLSLCVLRSEEGCDGFHDRGIHLDALNRSKLDPRTVFDLVKIIKRDKIQILHCHGYGSQRFVARRVESSPRSLPTYRRTSEPPMPSRGL